MAYKQPDDNAIRGILLKHKEQKLILESLESTEIQKQNNPILNSQRETVRKLYDQILMYDAYKVYPFKTKWYCEFRVIPECLGELKQTFASWFMYGNCCQVCNAYFGKTGAILYSIKDVDTYQENVHTIPEDIESSLDDVVDLSILDPEFL